MEDKNMDTIRSKLDGLALQILELINDDIQCKVNMERLIKIACLDLAKSRYIMGNSSVSALQLPTDEVTPLVTVESSRTDKVVYNLNRVIPNVKKPVAESEECTAQDPLKWFGVLVPQNLRKAQSCFQKAIEYSVQSANIAAEMDLCEIQFRTLLREKNQLEAKTNS